MNSVSDRKFSKIAARILSPIFSAAAFFCFQLEAQAVPVTAVLDLPPGGERFLRVDPNPVALVEPEGLITFETKASPKKRAEAGSMS